MENYDKDDALIVRPDEPDCAGHHPYRPGNNGCRGNHGCRPPRCREEEGPGHVHGCRPPRCREEEGPGYVHGCRPPRCREEERPCRRREGRPCGDPYGAASRNCPPPCLGRLAGERPCCAARRQRGLTAQP